MSAQQIALFEELPEFARARRPGPKRPPTSRRKKKEVTPVIRDLFEDILAGKYDNEEVVWTEADIEEISQVLFESAVSAVLDKRSSREKLLDSWAWILDTSEGEHNPFPFKACLQIHANREIGADDGYKIISAERYIEYLAGAAMHHGIWMPKGAKIIIFGDDAEHRQVPALTDQLRQAKQQASRVDH